MTTMPETATKQRKWSLGQCTGDGTFYKFGEKTFDTKLEAITAARRNYYGAAWLPIKTVDVPAARLKGEAWGLSRLLKERVYLAADKDDAAPRLKKLAKLLDERMADTGYVYMRPGWLSTEEGQDMLWYAVQLSLELDTLRSGAATGPGCPDSGTDYEGWRVWIRDTKDALLKHLNEHCLTMAEKARSDD